MSTWRQFQPLAAGSFSMLFPEADAPQLKRWIVKRLENTSDADADVLADYVLALLRHDGDTLTVRTLCEEEIPDFLQEDSSVFVTDVFDAIKYKSYLPGAPPPPRRSSFAPIPPPSAPTSTSLYGGDISIPSAPRGSHNISRKRSYNDRGDNDAQDGPLHQFAGDLNGRSFKQPRRGGGLGRGGRLDTYGNGRGGRQLQAQGINSLSLPPASFPALPQMPSPPPGMPPIDPNNPMAALFAMQAMGFPVPAMPQYPQVPSPVGQSSSTNNFVKPTRRPQRCRDYDTKGFCSRGNNCFYEHGTDSIFVPPSAVDEYDPNNSALMPGIESPSLSPMPPALSPSKFDSSRANERGRGRGRGQRGDRGAINETLSRRGGRAEFSSDRPNYDRTKTTIVVENIPEDKFTEETVREFFSEFGTINEVAMKPYKRLAVIKYGDWNAANAAYSSPKVIFDNRFVKVYWFTNNESLPKPPAVAGTNANGNGVQGGNIPAPVPARADSEPQIDMEEFARKQQEVQKAHEEKMKRKAEMEVAQKELERRQEELLKKQAEEKRKLMERLAAKTNKAGNQALKDGSSTPPVTEEKPSSQTEALKAQLAVLEAEARSLGLDTSLADDSSWNSRGRGRGRGGYRGRGTFVPRGSRGFDRGGYRGRGGAPFNGGGGAYKLDNRTKKVALTGVDFTSPDKDESLRQYLLGIGEFTDIETTPGKTSITFKDRFTAEKFMYGTTNGEIPSAGKVELAWVQTPLPPVILPAKTLSSSKQDSNDMMQIDEGDAMAQDMTSLQGSGGGQDNQEFDYDVADDNDWSVD